MKRNEKYWVACGDCGTVFDLREAKKCEHSEVGSSNFWTKECPNCGGCICKKAKEEPEKFRPANEEERKFGFDFMLKKEHGGVKNE